MVSIHRMMEMTVGMIWVLEVFFMLLIAASNNNPVFPVLFQQVLKPFYGQFVKVHAGFVKC